MRIAVHAKNFQDKALPFLNEMFEVIKQKDASLLLSTHFYEQLKEKENIILPEYETYQPYTNDIKKADFLFSIGGDGTLLECITHIADRQIPVLGINLGRLGFLATTSPDDIRRTIHCLENGYYSFDERSLLKAYTDKEIFGGLDFALNDFTITKRDTASMIVVHTYINGEYLNSYWADGLIVSTPTGSTGYSLSCGGPVVMPSSNNFIISPVSPHNLNVRPLIVSDDCVISFTIEGRSKNFLVSLDSRSYVIDNTVQIAVKKEKFKTKLVKLKEENFWDTLRNKLNWGLDARN
ncbi:MAG: NAD kinase [Cytophagales bacterium]|nr:MAG: NAD kinase [Cytophagales bacterium]